MTHAPGPCLLCGSETTETRVMLVEWSEPIGNAIWSSVPRCVDRAACRERVERVIGERWPVNDRTPAPPPKVEEIVPWLR